MMTTFLFNFYFMNNIVLSLYSLLGGWIDYHCGMLCKASIFDILFFKMKFKTYVPNTKVLNNTVPEGLKCGD